MSTTTTNDIAVFQAGQTYETRSIGDHECIFKLTVVSRTPTMAVVSYLGRHAKRVKIRSDKDGEYLQPERYSMAPRWCANRQHA